jgi:hypothetical protein
MKNPPTTERAHPDSTPFAISSPSPPLEERAGLPAVALAKEGERRPFSRLPSGYTFHEIALAKEEALTKEEAHRAKEGMSAEIDRPL